MARLGSDRSILGKTGRGGKVTSASANAVLGRSGGGDGGVCDGTLPGGGWAGPAEGMMDLRIVMGSEAYETAYENVK